MQPLLWDDSSINRKTVPAQPVSYISFGGFPDKSWSHVSPFSPRVLAITCIARKVHSPKSKNVLFFIILLDDCCVSCSQ